ncbi:MAG: hypothetical protein Q4D38_00855 [Planctomycetia bacterium]|nr:hypothetical protein [Planctomycetia bacterium]
MNNKIHLQQVFYGHDGVQYRVLAASDKGLADVVEKICEQIGSPDSSEKVQPFLLSVPVGTKLIMVHVQEGAPDRLGRQTLFFHALVAERSEARTFRFHAFSLQKMNLFKTTPSAVPLELDAKEIKAPELELESSVHFPGTDAPMYIRGAEPNPDRIRALGNQINEVAWSSFSFQALPLPFRLYVLSDRIIPPDNQYCADAPSTPPAAPTPTTPEKPTEKLFQKMLCALLCASLLLNVCLVGSLGWEKAVPTQKDEAGGSETNLEEAKREVLEEWRKEFKGKKIESDDCIKQTRANGQGDVDYKVEETHVETLKTYVNFLNEKLFNEERNQTQ